jgi:hypothetical protein
VAYDVIVEVDGFCVVSLGGLQGVFLVDSGGGLICGG